MQFGRKYRNHTAAIRCTCSFHIFRAVLIDVFFFQIFQILEICIKIRRRSVVILEILQPLKNHEVFPFQILENQSHLSRFSRYSRQCCNPRRRSTLGQAGSLRRWPGRSHIMEGGRKRSGSPEDSLLSRTRQRFNPYNFPEARRRNMLKAIAVALVVLGMFMTAGATPHVPKRRSPIHEPYRLSWAELREDLRRRKAFRRTFRMPEESFAKLADLLRPVLEKNEHYGRERDTVSCVCCAFLVARWRHFLLTSQLSSLSLSWVDFHLA